MDSPAAIQNKEGGRLVMFILFLSILMKWNSTHFSRNNKMLSDM